MPYQGESANHLANQYAMTNAGSFTNGLKIRKRDPLWTRLDNYVSNIQEEAPKRVIVLDGSKYMPENNELENMLCFFNIDQCIIDIEKLKNYLANPFPLPHEYKKIFNHQPVSSVLPILGLINETYEKEADLFRFSIFNFLSSHNPLLALIEKNGVTLKTKETLEQTLAALISHQCKIDAPIQPCMVCKKAGFALNINSFSTEDEGHYLGIKKKINCKCTTPTVLFMSDLLGLHEQLDEDTIPGLTSQMMLVFEKLLMINTIRNLAINKCYEYLKETIFVVDGTLSLYSHASWLSQAISKELLKIQKECDLMIVGVEKTGSFVKNFNAVDEYFEKKQDPLKNGMLYFLDDNYIKSYIKKYDSDNYYGEKNYFGKKMFYKNVKGKKYVLNLNFLSDEDKDIHINNRNDKSLIDQHKMLPQVLFILNNFASNAYPDAISLVSMAHEGAALAANQAAKLILDEFLRDYLIQNQ